MNAKPILIQLADRRIVQRLGYQIGQYTYGPVLLWNGQPSWERVSIRVAASGITVATFSDGQVAANFLRWLIGEWGDLSDTYMRSAQERESAEDARILDAIEARSLHVSRVWQTSP